jgi:phenylacetate-coenzyme A ligase PaaK-like adenylate-forming protein
MNEVESGKDYEVVLTQLHGMPLLRYRLGDLMTVMALKDGEAGINLPQWVFKTRLGDIIDLAALAVLDEKTVWQAIINSGIKYEEWSARKEYDGGQTYLRLYMELKEDKAADEVAHLIDRQLRVIDVDYRDVGDQLGLQPVRVSLLRPGTFQRYYLEKQEEGADLAHMKPPHMNPTDNAVEKLLRLSQRNQERS